MLYRIFVAERGLTGIANIFRSRLSRLDDLLRAGTVPLRGFNISLQVHLSLSSNYIADITYRYSGQLWVLFQAKLLFSILPQKMKNC